MKRLIVNILLWLPLVLMAQTAPTAAEVADKFLKKIDAQTLSANVSLAINDGKGQMNYAGKIRMLGSRFFLSMPGTEAAYDGKTFYLYTEDTDELSLSTPEYDELLEANPVLFAKELRKKATIRFASSKNADQYILEFIPQNQQAGVQKFVLKLRKSDLVPLEITVREGKQTTTVKFTAAQYSSATSSFVIKREGAYINDLR